MSGLHQLSIEGTAGSFGIDRPDRPDRTDRPDMAAGATIDEGGITTAETGASR